MNKLNKKKVFKTASKLKTYEHYAYRLASALKS